MIVVENVDGRWRRFAGAPRAVVSGMSTKGILQTEDGRKTEIEVEPYPIMVMLDPAKVQAFIDAGTWTADDLPAMGLALAEPFIVPEGKRVVGAPSYVDNDGTLQEVFEVEEIPPPPPPPSKDERLAALLDNYGLTKADVVELLTGSGGK